MKYVDLHNHSVYSDGTNTVEVIIEKAIEADVGFLAISDHNELAGAKELKKIVNGRLDVISAVELDAMQEGMHLHILAYGFDLENKSFNEFVLKNRKRLDDYNRLLVEKMLKDYSNISLEEYDEYRHIQSLGGWKTLHYLMDKKIISTIKEGFMIYEKYDLIYQCIDFEDVHAVCNYIHQAGGIAVLAHPKRSVKADTKQQYIQVFDKLVSLGIDGIECYYPNHDEQFTNLCVSYCEKHNLKITSGSDCHGTYEKTNIGQLKTLISTIKLDS